MNTWQRAEVQRNNLFQWTSWKAIGSGWVLPGRAVRIFPSSPSPSSSPPLPLWPPSPHNNTFPLASPPLLLSIDFHSKIHHFQTSNCSIHISNKSQVSNACFQLFQFLPKDHHQRFLISNPYVSPRSRCCCTCDLISKEDPNYVIIIILVYRMFRISSRLMIHLHLKHHTTINT